MWPFRRRKKQVGNVSPERLEELKALAGYHQPRDQPEFTPPKIAGRPSMSMDEGLLAASRAAGRPAGAAASYFNSHAFPIPVDMRGILANHWLIRRACSLPAEGALKNGFDLGDGHERLFELDCAQRLTFEMEEFVRMARVYGQRMIFFDMGFEGERRRRWLEAPFNEDAIRPGMYRGMVQIEPQDIRPLETISRDVLRGEPRVEWYEVQGQRVHASHFFVYTPFPVTDALARNFQHGGVSVPQLMLLPTYRAERSADEGPKLLATKRHTVFKVRLPKDGKSLEGVESMARQFQRWRDNYGIQIAFEGDEVEQLDTPLGDVVSVTDQQFHLVAAAVGVPITKLLGTPPKGMDATGEHDAKNYADSLASLQKHALTPLLVRHYRYLALSNGLSDSPADIQWRPTDTPTRKELAEIELMDSQTASNYDAMGVLDPGDIQQRLAGDPTGTYFGLRFCVGGSEEDGS